MLPKQYFRCASAVWWTCLLVFAIILTGCGGATSDSANNTADEKSTTTEQTKEVSVQEEAEPESEKPASESQPVAAGTTAAECRAATPENDPLMALMQPNSAIAQVSDADWSKGPADAPITIIEYGDFQ